MSVFNGYAEHHPVDLTVRADMLETIAGFPVSEYAKELTFAMAALDVHDPESLRWLACLCAAQVAVLNG